MSDEGERLQDPESGGEYFTEEQRAYIKKMVEKLMEKRILVVYGDEDEKGEGICYDDDGRKKQCKAVCCSFIFALTKTDVEKGHIRWNAKKPYFIERDEDGYCPHLDRGTLQCTIWERRPERCRHYDCRTDASVWVDWDKRILHKDIFNHLPASSRLLPPEGEEKDGKSEERT